MTILIELRPQAGRVLVVGAGKVGLRRARQFVAAGFDVDVVAPEVAPGFQALQAVSIWKRPFQDTDLAGHALVCCCTDDRAVNEHVGRLARARGVPVSVADAAEEGTFFVPALHRDGDLLVAVGTSGASPGLAREVRDRISTALGTGWGSVVDSARRDRAALRRVRRSEP